MQLKNLNDMWLHSCLKYPNDTAIAERQSKSITLKDGKISEQITKRAESVKFEDIDIIEIHEAFASQVLSVFKESKKKYKHNWELDKINTYGGSIAYTHPLGATNYRLITNVFSRFNQNPKARYALATGCAGGGLGVSFLFERYF